jgi:hypothetical protein
MHLGMLCVQAAVCTRPGYALAIQSSFAAVRVLLLSFYFVALETKRVILETLTSLSITPAGHLAVVTILWELENTVFCGCNVFLPLVGTLQEFLADGFEIGAVSLINFLNVVTYFEDSFKHQITFQVREDVSANDLFTNISGSTVLTRIMAWKVDKALICGSCLIVIQRGKTFIQDVLNVLSWTSR